MLVPLVRTSRKGLSSSLSRRVSSFITRGYSSDVSSATAPSRVQVNAAVGRGNVLSFPNLNTVVFAGAFKNLDGHVRTFSTTAEKDESKGKEAETKAEAAAEAKEQQAEQKPDAAEAEAKPADKEEGKPEEKKEETVEEKLAKSEEKVKSLEETVQELKHKYLTSLADVENMRMRMNRKSEEDKRFAVRSFAKNMLEVADCLEKALEAMPEEKRKADENLQTVFEGVQMIDVVFLKALKEAEIAKFHPMGDKFDPNTMNAMFELPAGEGQEKGQVGHVVKSGYMIHDRVLRPAEVGVTK